MTVDPENRLRKTDLAETLDRSEKTALSYAVGQAMTGVFCRQVLGVSHLMHVDRYHQRWGVNFAGNAGGSRPDLFGRIAPSSWVVAEAKGRSNRMETGLRQILMIQKSTIATIGGHVPHVALGCVTSFPPVRGRPGPMVVNAVDPEADQEAVDLEVDETRFFQTYYEPFVAAISAGERAEGPPDFVTATVLGTGVRVGLQRNLYDSARLERWPESNSLSEMLSNVDTSEFRSDGSYVSVDWADSLATSGDAPEDDGGAAR